MTLLILSALFSLFINAQELHPALVTNSGNVISQKNTSPVLAEKDTDGDGIPDRNDLDDDNDGIPDAIEALSCGTGFSFCDSDNDGIPNSSDLDSDNDGIPDIEEAGFASYSNNKATIDPANWIDANANGLHDAIEAMLAAGTYHLPDTDNDGVKDFTDLDSDNDGLFDVDEAGERNGDGDRNGDGVGDGIDSDGDGILDVFDTLTGFGSVDRPLARKTSGNSKADYQKTDSDGDGIYDIATTLFSHLDTDNDGMINAVEDIDHDGILDIVDTDVTNAGSPRSLNNKLFVEFDGRNDYGDGMQLLSNLNQASMMGWIKLSRNSSEDVFVMGQENFNISLRSSNNQLAATANGTTILSSENLELNRWYHISAVYNANDPSAKLKLYLNGKEAVSSNNGALSGHLNTATAKFTFAKNPVADSNYFNGGIDEIRVFKTALTDDMIQKMVYQEIRKNGAAIRGEIIPKDIEGLSWSSLLAYYKMDTFQNDATSNLISENTTAAQDITAAHIYNVKNIRLQLAPMPFTTTRAGNLETSISPNSSVRASDANTYVWSIIKIKHNTQISANQTSLGMFIEPGVTVSIDNENKLQNTWYLKLDGKIDLKGKSQLVQTEFSELDATSTGYIEKDQSGQSNIYNYNYWCSPVGAVSPMGNNSGYNINAVMKDATNPESLKNITWTSTMNGAPTTPITVSSFWIFKFQNLNAYTANWSSVGSTGILHAGEGFSMKGSGALGAYQNYAFTGKPNNGDINVAVSSNTPNLCGNPYPSALDTDRFIADNVTSTTGAIYLWENYVTNNTHYQTDHQGGYATRSLVGGTPAMSPIGQNNSDSQFQTPGRYIPVGQAFFMVGISTAGDIKFRNTQRAFVKETNTASTNVFKNNASPSNSNIEDAAQADGFARIRIGFDTPDHYHRQLLIGFMDNLATDGIDTGYDAQSIDTQPTDLFFENRLNIQGVGAFNTDNSYPLMVKSSTGGISKFVLDKIENMDEQQPIYIFDNVTQQYHDLRNDGFEINIPAGATNGRFSLRFKDPSALATTNFSLNNDVLVAYATNDNTIVIKNNNTDVTIETVMLFNMLGQSVNQWNVKNELQTKISIPVTNLSSGTYIIKVHTNKGELSKKVTIR